MFQLLWSLTTVALLGGPGPRSAPAGMATIPAGTVVPLHGAPVAVGRFALDRTPVTRAEFVGFVNAHHEWRRSGIEARFADRGYLADWRADDDVGGVEVRVMPVVNVSWHAAAAYCAAQGKRLPTTAEWERAAMASGARADATADRDFVAQVMTAYTQRATAPLRAAVRGERNVFGVRGLHDLVWEWTSDFDGTAVAHAAHEGHAAGAARPMASCASAAIGASNTTNYPAFLRDAVRAGLERSSITPTLGFRCAADVS